LLVGDRPAGTVRLDRRDRRAWGPLCEVSITIAPDCRSRGLGKAALALARRQQPASPLVARVKASNRASRRLFLAAGYQPLAPGVFVHWPQRWAGVVGMAAAE
jgi:L-amino acid N-acyltransferase YncA